jgi:hypothetical protein
MIGGRGVIGIRSSPNGRPFWRSSGTTHFPFTVPQTSSSELAVSKVPTRSGWPECSEIHQRLRRWEHGTGPVPVETERQLQQLAALWIAWFAIFDIADHGEQSLLGLHDKRVHVGSSHGKMLNSKKSAYEDHRENRNKGVPRNVNQIGQCHFPLVPPLLDGLL